MIKMRWMVDILLIAWIHMTTASAAGQAARGGGGGSSQHSSSSSSESDESGESIGPYWIQSRHDDEMENRARWRLEGQVVTLECRASGKPKPTLTWLRNERDVIVGNARYVADKWSLVISQLQEDDTAIFTCRAENTAGLIEKHFALIVFGRGNMSVPQVRTVSPTQQTVLIGQRSNFTCRVETLSPSLVQWVRYESESPTDGDLTQSHHSNRAVLKEVYINGSRILSLDGWRTSHQMGDASSRDHHVINLSLVLKNVSEADSGDYACVASNSGGITQKRVRLKVMPNDLFAHTSTTNTDLIPRPSELGRYEKDSPETYIRSIVVAVCVVFTCVVIAFGVMVVCGIRKALRSEETVYQEVLDLTT